MEDGFECVWKVYGCPGTGKTTFLSGNPAAQVVGQVQRAAESYGAQMVRVSAFTKAAAHEIGSRLGGIPEKNVGTLHSLCFHALGCPALTEGEEADFNAFAARIAPKYRFELTVRKKRGKKKAPAESSEESEDVPLSPLDDPFEAPLGETQGDALRTEMDLLRSRMVPREKWPPALQPFAQVYGQWKKEAGLLDFTDLLEQVLHSFDTCPGNPAAFFLDEAQDCSALQMALMRQWAPGFRRLILAGDDDQAIYTFAGADANNLIDFPCLPGNRRSLSPSYRVPGLIHAASLDWVRTLSRREDKKSLPRGEEGTVDFSPATFYNPERAIDEAERWMAQGKRVMFLASCSYMLKNTIAVLRQRGLPYHNPWRQKRGDWNPLRRGGREATFPLDRLLAFLSPCPWLFGQEAPLIWSLHDFSVWASALDAKKNLMLGAKKRMLPWKGSKDPVDMIDIIFCFLKEKHAEIESLNFSDKENAVRSVKWFLENILESQQSKYEYPCKVFEHHPCSINEIPLVTVGTGHSLKGAEADVCFVFPDLSRKGWLSWEDGSQEEHDAIIRLFYVMMTRARERLVVCERASPLALRIA